MALAFQDEHIEAHVAPGSSPYLLVTFAPSTLFANGKRFWGDNFVAKAKIAALGIIAKKPNWYPRSSMEAMRAALGDHLDGFGETVTYGASMGAFGAVRYGALLKASTVISFSPQYSINPAVVQSWDRRFLQYYDAGVDAEATLRPGDVAGRTFVFYDNLHAIDRRSAESVAALGDGIRMIKVPMVGHQPIELFAGTQKALSLIDACRTDTLAGMAATIAGYRRASTARTVAMVETLAKRRPALAERILQDRLVTSPELTLFRLRYHVANGYLRTGSLDAARAIAKVCLTYKNDEGVLRLLADIAQRQRDYIGALDYLRAALKINDKQAVTHSRLSSVYHSMGRFKEAMRAIDTAMELYPDNASFASLRDKIVKDQAAGRDWLVYGNFK